ncbi:unnamed protein product [Peniophora sp. CBMAI 1063]|nr:unnamed protein product [Peniophora sp. CBMAI 1063]
MNKCAHHSEALAPGYNTTFKSTATHAITILLHVRTAARGQSRCALPTPFREEQAPKYPGCTRACRRDEHTARSICGFWKDYADGRPSNRVQPEDREGDEEADKETLDQPPPPSPTSILLLPPRRAAPLQSTLYASLALDARTPQPAFTHTVHRSHRLHPDEQ